MSATKVSFILFLWFFIPNLQAKSIDVSFNPNIIPIRYGVTKLELALKKQGFSTFYQSKRQTVENGGIVIITEDDINQPEMFGQDGIKDVKPEGFNIFYYNDNKTLYILAKEAIGAMYGILELTEHFESSGDYKGMKEGIRNPHFEYRIIKFNLPWSPYRDNPATTQHTTTCRDLKYWERFLDMMAENRFNVLSLWNNHPFPYMIRAKNYPEATPFNDVEMAEWQQFWKTLFRMAKDRGIQTFIVNWNIVVSPEFAEAYGAEEYNDASALVKKYTRESVAQVIDAYPDLTGIGVTLADWMGNFDGKKMTPKEREDWIEDTFVAGMKEASRKVKFLHRSVLAGDPMEMRRIIDAAELKDPALVEIKFNWSHGHSTPHLSITHDYHSGEIDDRFWTPKPTNYNIQWMIRNEDFFILRWGQPDFIRSHLSTNDHDYVNGYFIGSEGYIPALDYSQKPGPIKTWQYAFEKQWLFYTLWGRLLYDPECPDEVFEQKFDMRYGPGTGEDLLKAYTLASQMPLRLASFYRATWDYTLYSEGFLAPRPASSDAYFDNASPFISIDELIYHQTLDPSLLSIVDYINMVLNNKAIPPEKISPLTLAEASITDSDDALNMAESLQAKVTPFNASLASELDDIRAWAWLGKYFGLKIKAGVDLQLFRNTGKEGYREAAIENLEQAVEVWSQLVINTTTRYLPTPHVSISGDNEDYKAFSWAYFLPEVERDIEIAKKASKIE